MRSQLLIVQLQQVDNQLVTMQNCLTGLMSGKSRDDPKNLSSTRDLSIFEKSADGNVEILQLFDLVSKFVACGPSFHQAQPIRATHARASVGDIVPPNISANASHSCKIFGQRNKHGLLLT